jgi:hypothetical protein
MVWLSELQRLKLRSHAIWNFQWRLSLDRTPTHGYAATREDAMAAFAEGWRRE